MTTMYWTVNKDFLFLFLLGLSTLLQQMDKPDVTIAVDGSLYEFHPRIKIWINKFVQILAPSYEVLIYIFSQY